MKSEERSVPDPARYIRLKRPHLVCGLCDEPFEPGEDTVYCEDERVHRDCARRFWSEP